jgi:hypothetical protein
VASGLQRVGSLLARLQLNASTVHQATSETKHLDRDDKVIIKVSARTASRMTLLSSNFATSSSRVAPSLRRCWCPTGAPSWSDLCATRWDFSVVGLLTGLTGLDPEKSWWRRRHHDRDPSNVSDGRRAARGH